MFMDKIPVRLRLSLAHAMWMAVLFLVIGIGLYNFLSVKLHDSVDAALMSSARAVREARFGEEGTRGTIKESIINNFFRDPWPIDEFTGERYIRPFAQIIDVSGKVSSKTSNIIATLPVTPLAVDRAELGLPTFETFNFKDKPPFRQITLPVLIHEHFTGELVQVGASLRETLDTLKGTALMLWTILPLVLLVSILFGYVLTALALKPVNAFSKAAAELGIDDLSIRLPQLEANDELSELSQTFNSMLDRLEDNVKRLRRFSGDVSHELRTPLAVLRGEAELALRRLRTTQEYESALRNIVKESIHMTKIINDLLLLARAESQSIALNWETVDAADFMEEIRENVNIFFQEKNVRLQIQLLFKGNIICAKGFLEIAVKNLLLNAAKHSLPGTKVLFTLKAQEKSLIFNVQDEGEGIPPDALPYIFDPFFRADTARNRANGGSGIGLSLAQALVKLHSGRIKVSSEVGKGSSFDISIPLGIA